MKDFYYPKIGLTSRHYEENLGLKGDKNNSKTTAKQQHLKY
jgi:hypothetical protein